MVWCDSRMHVWGTGITKMAGNWAYVSPDEEKSFVWSNACFPVLARSLQIIEMQVYF